MRAGVMGRLPAKRGRKPGLAGLGEGGEGIKKAEVEHFRRILGPPHGKCEARRPSLTISVKQPAIPRIEIHHGRKYEGALTTLRSGRVGLPTPDIVRSDWIARRKQSHTSRPSIRYHRLGWL